MYAAQSCTVHVTENNSLRFKARARVGMGFLLSNNKPADTDVRLFHPLSAGIKPHPKQPITNTLNPPSEP
jgi:hypothetical protein